jgi:hypothetical protein
MSKTLERIGSDKLIDYFHDDPIGLTWLSKHDYIKVTSSKGNTTGKEEKTKVNILHSAIKRGPGCHRPPEPERRRKRIFKQSSL